MSIRELMQPTRTRDLDWLRDALQAAIRLEFFTIPPYLMAMWSIKDPSHPAAHTIRAVVYEEMQHMALTCNMLAAIGGTPSINRPSAVPEYPRPLPGGVNPGLVVGLAGLSHATLDVFMKVEAPATPLVFEEALEEHGETFANIGEFYRAIQGAFEDLDPPLSVDRQITGPLAPLIISSLDDVNRALNQICVQGEGSDASPSGEEPGELGDDPAQLAHYYRFEELRRERRLDYDAATQRYRWGASWPLPAVYPVAPVPAGGYRYDEVTENVAVHLRTFDRTYSRMLDTLQTAWEGGGQGVLWRAVELMFALQGPARELMALTIPGTEQTYGPNFRRVIY